MKLRSLGILVAAVAATAFGAMGANANTIQFNYNAGASTPATGLYAYDVVVDNLSHLAPASANEAGIVDYPALVTAGTSFTASGALTGAGYGFLLTFPATSPVAAPLNPLVVDGANLNVQLNFTGGTSDLTNATLGLLKVQTTRLNATLV